MQEWQHDYQNIFPLQRVGQHAGINSTRKIFSPWVSMQEWWVNMNRNSGSTWSGIYSTDHLTAMVIRRNSNLSAEDFPQQVMELKTYFSKENNTGKVRAIPGEGVDIPMWILGSSTDSAHLAAYFGMPYAFAGHFAPQQMQNAFTIYRREFKPSD